MDILYVIGDLIDAPEILIAHGCNARGVYNAGMAGAIRKRLPFAYEAYLDAHRSSDDFRLGAVIHGIAIERNQRPRIVANMITQLNYGRDPNRVYVSYEAIETAIARLDHFVSQTQDGTIDIANVGQITRVGFPLIGCGLGNGSWSIISKIIETGSHHFQPVVYTLDGNIPES
jgi:O-acetyl-ADP-ribose deacetylase (regulator of RNase III)